MISPTMLSENKQTLFASGKALDFFKHPCQRGETIFLKLEVFVELIVCEIMVKSPYKPWVALLI